MSLLKRRVESVLKFPDSDRAFGDTVRPVPRVAQLEPLEAMTQDQVSLVLQMFPGATVMHPLDAWVGKPIEERPCETGLISEITECGHCQFACKVGDDKYTSEHQRRNSDAPEGLS